MPEPLLPCPFCGANAVLLDRVCGCLNPKCDVDGPQGRTAAEAVAAWNRRAPLAAPTRDTLARALETVLRDYEVYDMLPEQVADAVLRELARAEEEDR